MVDKYEVKQDVELLKRWFGVSGFRTVGVFQLTLKVDLLDDKEALEEALPEVIKHRDVHYRFIKWKKTAYGEPLALYRETTVFEIPSG